MLACLCFVGMLACLCFVSAGRPALLKSSPLPSFVFTMLRTYDVSHQMVNSSTHICMYMYKFCYFHLCRMYRKLSYKDIERIAPLEEDKMPYRLQSSSQQVRSCSSNCSKPAKFASFSDRFFDCPLLRLVDNSVYTPPSRGQVGRSGIAKKRSHIVLVIDRPTN